MTGRDWYVLRKSTGGALTEYASANDGVSFVENTTLSNYALPYAEPNFLNRRGGVIRYGGGHVLVGGRSSNVARRSAVSSTWSAATFPPAGMKNIYDFAYDGVSRWVAAGTTVDICANTIIAPYVATATLDSSNGSPIRYGTNAVNWFSVPAIMGTVSNVRSLATDSAGNWIAGGNKGVLYNNALPSTHWSNVTTGISNGFAVAYGNGRFYHFGYNGVLGAASYSTLKSGPWSADSVNVSVASIYGAAYSFQGWTGYGLVYPGPTVRFVKPNISGIWSNAGISIINNIDFTVSDTAPGKLGTNGKYYILVGSGASTPIIAGVIPDTFQGVSVMNISDPSGTVFNYRLNDVVLKKTERVWYAFGEKRQGMGPYESVALVSTDALGTSWTTIPTPTYAALNGATWTGGKSFFLAGKGGSGSNTAIQYSTTDVSSTNNVLSEPATTSNVAYNVRADTFGSAFQNRSSIFSYSDDNGLTWNDTASGGYFSTNVVFSNSRWLGAGYSVDPDSGCYKLGTWVSFDGSNWFGPSSYRNQFAEIGNHSVITAMSDLSGVIVSCVRGSNDVLPGSVPANRFYFTQPNDFGFATSNSIYPANDSSNYYNALTGGMFYYPSGLPRPELRFTSALGNGPVFNSPASYEYIYYQYAPIVPIQIQAGDGCDGFTYYFIDATSLPRGLVFDGLTGLITGTPVLVANRVSVPVYAKDDCGVSTITLVFSVIIPRSNKLLDTAASYTAMLRQYTIVNAEQNARDNIVLAGGTTLGSFMAPQPPDVVSATIPANCSKSC
jgi:hypothetical protein